MLTPVYPLSRSRFRRNLSRSLLIGSLSTLSLLSGFTPILEQCSWTPIFSSSAFAQSVSDEELQRYARSLLAIEPIRQAAYDEIKRILGTGEVPSITCNRPNSLNRLDANIREIAVNYCNQSTRIVERNNLSIGRFNTITTILQDDPDLLLRIQQEMLRLQSP